MKCIGRNPFLPVLCRIAEITVCQSSDKRDLAVFSVANAKAKILLKLICQIFHFVFKILPNFTI